MRTGVIYDPVYLEHETGEHPENSSRLSSIMSYLEESSLTSQLVPIAPRAATIDELSLIHHISYIDYIRSICDYGGKCIDSDTIVSPHSYTAAIFAAGGAITAAESVMEGNVDNAFALVRPPGHHATPREAMGFCIFNNIAIAAKYIISKYGLERIAIIDFDVHHCNGTQIAFESKPEVLCVSIHQHPLFPGTGRIDETGSGKAMGTNVNIPLPPRCGDSEYELAFKQIIVPVVKRYQPQLILVSAGFDAHWADTISSMQVSVKGFFRMMSIIKYLAEEECNNRLAAVLEGGYHLDALRASVKATFDVLIGNDYTKDPLGPSPYQSTREKPPDINYLIQRIQEVHRLTVEEPVSSQPVKANSSQI